MEMRKSELFKQVVAPKYTFAISPNAPKLDLWPIFKNPGLREFVELKKCYNWESSRSYVRGIVSKTGDVYMWPSEILHEFMEEDFPDIYDHNKYMTLTINNYKEFRDTMKKLEEMNWFEEVVKS